MRLIFGSAQVPTMRLLVNPGSHCLVILSGGFALIFRQCSGDSKNAPQLLVEFSSESSLPDLGQFTEIRLSEQHKPGFLSQEMSPNSYPINANRWSTRFQTRERRLYGFLGLYASKGSVYAGFVTERSEVGSATVGQKIYRVDNVVFVSLSGECYDYYEDASSDLESLNGGASSGFPSRIISVCKLLASGTFYYSPDFDMSSTVQGRGGQAYVYRKADNRFVWNGNMIEELVKFRSRLCHSEREAFDRGRFMLTVIRGYAQSLTVKRPSHSILLTIISKQDCKKNGPMFGPYGLDDNGNATNFVETEFILSDRFHCLSYLLLRGNVPLFWKLETQLMSTKVQFPRSSEASKHAFIRHFRDLVDKYGNVHVVDALSSKGGQPKLSKRYHEALTANLSDSMCIEYSKVDAAQCSAKKSTHGSSWEMMSYLEDSVKKNRVCSGNVFQDGTFLINTLDSNDRANFIEMRISKKILDVWLPVEFDVMDDVWNDILQDHLVLWDANGRSLGQLAESYNNSIRTKTKRGGFVGKMAKQSKKYVTPQMTSQGKQTQFDKLLGRQQEYQVKLVDPIHNCVKETLASRKDEYTSPCNLRVFACTFNVNAVQFKGDLREFLFPRPEAAGYDLVVVGLEEVVELTPGKIMNIDKTIRLFWEKKIAETLQQGGDYVLLQGEQLGGILNLVFVRADNLEYIREIETGTKKTGLKGMAANKGGVAIAFSYGNSARFCFVVSHLAAGHSNVEERHQDFKTIANGLRFRQNRMLRDFDVVIWMGDFNFRIDLANDVVRKAIKEGARLSRLFEFDQLNKQMAHGKSFPFFDEAEITFPPTYKFDKGTDTYDTSEKQRVPSWTDRIVTLTRDKKMLTQQAYGSVPWYKFSDHKPVYGLFSVDVDLVDRDKRNYVEQGLYELRKAEVGGLSSIIFNDPVETKVLRYGLPAPSTRNSKWWLEGDEVRVRFPELDSGEYMVNPALPKNPFTPTENGDFVRSTV